ncbi:DUF1064 domain-containing protein [Sharpea azabuensis]|uniref:DUF1064 domain-containing protein n=1 Tax=Sharpea azabuensis TaxID=322505 RepID=UPI002E810C72|nr:DUF1064 domain-containing protein [Sharpea azabuensis]MEE3307867.1 DUF1064 domain-containing protein [Sharpea azabuensis]
MDGGFSKKLFMKYHNKKVVVDGMKFDSKKESQRFLELSLMQRGGYISDLQRQVKYILIPSQKIDGKVVEREVSYKADFVYKDNTTGKTVVEDVKGVKTKDYIIKRKLMLFIKGIRIKEV